MPTAEYILRLNCLFCLMLGSQTLLSQAAPANPIAPVQAAVQNLTQAAAVINSQVQQASSETQSKVEKLPQPTIEAKPEVQTASDADKAQLCDAVTKFSGHAQSEEETYSALALAMILAATGLALVGGIASFLAKNKLAGIISLIVAAVVGFSNAYPLGPIADFYYSLAADAKALDISCRLAVPYTLATYTSELNQLKLLYVYEEKRPGFGNRKPPTDDLTSQLQVVRTTANNVTVAQTEAAVNLARQAIAAPPSMSARRR
jgi:hypothetical protein